MAFLSESRLLITDAANVPISGGKARIYDANTTNLTPVFSDVGLTVPLANPVVADSSGITPQIFGAEGTLVDVQYLTAAGVSIPGRSYVDWVFVGADTGDFTRTLADSTRLKFTGSGGRVLMQVGDPDPDNTGGKLTIEGQGGTQADDVLIDAALLDTTGRIREGGKKLSGTVYTEATTFTAAANVDVPLPNNPSGVRAWKIHFFDLTASGTVSIWYRFSYDGGATFKDGAADYGFAASHNVNNTFVGTTSAGAIQINVDNVLAGAKKGFVELTVLTPDAGADPTMLLGHMLSFEGTTPSPSVMNFGGYGLGSYGRATHLRMTSTSPTFTGKYRIERLYGFGET